MDAGDAIVVQVLVARFKASQAPQELKQIGCADRTILVKIGIQRCDLDDMGDRTQGLV
ncbi:MAG: hypothetical protein RLZZ314_820, partial [Bacteroidota bacterium]